MPYPYNPLPQGCKRSLLERLAIVRYPDQIPGSEKGLESSQRSLTKSLCLQSIYSRFTVRLQSVLQSLYNRFTVGLKPTEYPGTTVGDKRFSSSNINERDKSKGQKRLDFGDKPDTKQKLCFFCLLQDFQFLVSDPGRQHVKVYVRDSQLTFSPNIGFCEVSVSKSEMTSESVVSVSCSAGVRSRSEILKRCFL
jgi:hypothetical protein